MAKEDNDDLTNSESSNENVVTGGSAIAMNSGPVFTNNDDSSNSKLPDCMSSGRHGNENDTKNVMTRVELKDMLHSAYCGSLECYLRLAKKNTSALAMLQFYHASWSFQHGNFRNKFEQTAECSSIFDRFISRNSEDQIGVSDEIRRYIARNIHMASPFVFKVAADWAFEHLHDVYWHPF